MMKTINLLYKARCNIREDLQQEGEDNASNRLYAAVAVHETIRILLSLTASRSIGLKAVTFPMHTYTVASVLQL